MYKTNRIGPKTLPCGIPLIIFAHSLYFYMFSCASNLKNVQAMNLKFAENVDTLAGFY